MKRILIVFALLSLMSLGIPALAQDDVVNAPNPNAQITFPPPVYVLRGAFEVRGTANLPNMTSYFIEYRPLNDDLTPTNRDVWFPATLPSQSAVVDDVLGVWDTELAAGDGLYEIRLTVNVSDGEPVTQIITPLRIENVPPPFVVVNTPVPTMTPTSATPPTQTPIPPTPTSTAPRATITSTPSGNVRTGDSLAYAVITSLAQGTELEIIGISNRGTGWFQVRLPNNQSGWVSPTIVETTGDLSTLQRVQPPPPPPPTATPIPTIVPATAVPVVASNANLVAGIVELNPGTPSCAQTFTVGFDVANLGSQPTAASGTVSLVDVRAADGSQQGTTVGGFPVLQPGQTFRVNMPLTVSTWYNETHRITLIIDPSNAIPENNEGDNSRTIEYTLQKGSCP